MSQNQKLSELSEVSFNFFGNDNFSGIFFSFSEKSGKNVENILNLLYKNSHTVFTKAVKRR